MNKRRNDLLIKFRADLRTMDLTHGEIDINYIMHLMQFQNFDSVINTLRGKDYIEGLILDIVKSAYQNELLLDVDFYKIEDYAEAEKDEDDEDDDE